MTPLPIAETLRQIAERFEAAEKRRDAAHAAGQIGDRNDAGWEMMLAAGDYWAAQNDLAQLFELMLRTALEVETTSSAVQMWLAEGLRPELTALVELIQGGDN